MSRIIVKNLAPGVSEAWLRDTFASLGGRVTDTQLKFTPQGQFRHFGFVGFEREVEAQAAQKHFDRNYLKGSKIQVELCADLGDPRKPRAWSRHAPDASAHAQRGVPARSEAKAERRAQRAERLRQAEAVLEPHREDPKFQEFLQTQAGGPGFSAEARPLVGPQAAPAPEPVVQAAPEAGPEPTVPVSDLAFLQARTKKTPKNETYYTVKLSGLPLKWKKKELKAFLRPLKAKSIRRPPQVGGIAYVGLATPEARQQLLLKHKSFLSGHQVQVKAYERVGPPADGPQAAAWAAQAEGLVGEETVAESGRLFLRNLSYGVTEADLETLFQPFGALAEVNLPLDRVTRQPKGFAFLTYVIPENATQALAALDGTSFQGRLLHLLPGKAKPSPEDLANAEGLTFKQKKALKEKAQAQSSHNWNSLFLGTSAVADLMAEKYNVSKSDVLTGDGKQSAAVRLALGETEIVAETRAYLQEEGIQLDTFSRPPNERSKTVILVKNLPAKTSPLEIRDRFAKFGELGRLVLPPHGITAIVEFLDPSEARKGFQGLAYTKFHNTPLYLEWAPQNAFVRELTPEEIKAKLKEEVDQDSGVDIKDEPEEGTTLFVKNLNFSTQEESLKEFFATVGPVHSATISKKKDMKRPGEMLSMGYGFVQFKLKSSADKALKNLQHKRLDEHGLELKRSTRVTSAQDQVQTTRKLADANSDPSKSTTKLIVRNVPFEAHQKEIEDIFKTFGDLKSVRLPKKATGSHRGFGFIEFATKGEAQKAFQALCHSTHLYGRRLVLEWAEQEETVEDLRRKTAAQFVDGPPANKRLKKSDVIESMALK
eukprot:maker-scaffold130_size324016-snap-gene-2.23 protein:Tk07108 transcript:maker-scaffold130_size324016-snap-gene-2.23-mRNA-1 annotation:"rna-binding protein 19"